MDTMRRRRFIQGVGLLLAMPAIITTPGLLMPVKKPPLITNSWVAEFAWGGFDRAEFDFMVPAKIIPEEFSYEEAPVMVLPKDRWGGARGLLADRINLLGNKSLEWHDREISQILTDEFGWPREMRA
jgi:hypothetical protein